MRYKRITDQMAKRIYWRARRELVLGAFVDLVVGALVDFVVGAFVDLVVGAFVDFKVGDLVDLEEELRTRPCSRARVLELTERRRMARNWAVFMVDVWGCDVILFRIVRRKVPQGNNEMRFSRKVLLRWLDGRRGRCLSRVSFSSRKWSVGSLQSEQTSFSTHEAADFSSPNSRNQRWAPEVRGKIPFGSHTDERGILYAAKNVKRKKT